ncbi:MAG: DUF3817 domain-containing protein [Bacteroidia bacterium]
MNIRTPLGRFRLIALLEGISFLILLFIAMPLKYGAGIPQAVSVSGMTHGVLFVAYMLFLILVREDQNWSFGKVVKSALVSLVPFGTFYADKHWWSPKQRV